MLVLFSFEGIFIVRYLKHSVCILLSILIISEICTHFIYNLFSIHNHNSVWNCILLHEFLWTILAVFKVAKNFLSGWYDMQLFYTFPGIEKMELKVA